MRTRAASAESGTKEEVDARYDLAKQLVQSGDLDRATEEFFWVWTHSKGTSGYGGESQGTLEWFDGVKDKPEWWPLIRRVEFRLDDLLEAEGRWSDLARLYPDPLEELRSEKAMLSNAQRVSEGKDGDRAELLSTVHQQLYRRTARKLYAIMLAAGRTGDADAVLAEAIRSDDTAEMRIELIDYALKVDRPEAKHLELVVEAEKLAANNENLRRLVANTKAKLARVLTGASSK